jgi:glycosyltransferase involved in cell wall biosynthesis
LPEIVDDGRTGITIEAGDVDGAVAAVRSLFEDPALAERLGTNGRREVQTTYSMASHMDRLEATYRELID